MTSVLEEKQKMLAEDRDKLMPLMLKDEAGDITDAEVTELDRLSDLVDYNELYCQKFGVFKAEIDGKLEYATKEFEELSDRANKLIAKYGCNPSDYKPKDLFKLFYTFAKDFSEAFQKLQAKIKAEEEKLRKAGQKKQPRATVVEEEGKSVRDLIEIWKAQIASAEELKTFGQKKKPPVPEEQKSETESLLAPKPVKKAKRISNRGGSVVRNVDEPLATESEMSEVSMTE